jgi:tetratricopeptide (TPR) repeat protein
MPTSAFDDYLWSPLKSGDFTTALNRCAHQLDSTKAADAIHIGGLALVKMNRLDDGFKWLEASLTLMRAAPEWFDNAANALAEKKDYVRAEQILQWGLAYYPSNFRLNYIRAVMYSYMNKNEEALQLLARLRKLFPESREIMLTTGYTYHMMARFEDALQEYSKITNLERRQQEELDNNISGVLMDMTNYPEALSILADRYIEDPSSTTTYNQSLVELGLGMWPKAWDHHVARPCLGVPAHIKRPAKLLDLWNKEIFYFAEQGFGDCIQFIRYAPILHQHCGRMTIGVPSGLIRLFNCLVDPKPFDILPTGGTLGRFDLAIPFLDAPTLLQTTVATIPADIPYFKLPTNVIPRWERGNDARPHVGVVWRGASRNDDPRAYSLDKRRSIPFETITPLLQLVDHVVFVSLQLDDTSKDPRMLHPLQSNFDMFDTAMVVNQLDLIITIDSSICHLAGALGKKVWMLSRFDSCWRWFWDGRNTSPWYPSMRIFRQPEHNTWPRVVAEVKEELEKLFP